MNSIQQDIQEVQITIEQAKEMVAFGDAIERLFKNRDFKRVVLEGYFEKEAIRYVKLLGDPNLPEKAREDVLRDMAGIGTFNYFLEMSFRKAAHMRHELQEHQATLDELQVADAEGAE